MVLHNGPANNGLTYVFDLDGVVYRGSEPLPRAAEVIQALRSQGCPVHFFTNNSSLSRKSYSSKLESMGIPTPVGDIMTSSYATALYLLEKHASGKTVYQIGEQGITEELEAVGMKVVNNCDEPDAHADYVVVGMDRSFSYNKLARAQKAILDGAEFIATNDDTTYPTEGGGLAPGSGSLVAAVQTATSVDPVVIGKPRTYALEKILEMTNTPPSQAVIIGDRLETDIAVGNRAGTETVLVLTGIASREDAERALGELKPDRIIETLQELLS